jgi:transcriptional regulator with XRE-family HTH domain
MESVNDRLRYFLKNNGLSQEEAAKRLNISPQRLNNWLAKSSIPMYNLTDLLELFPNLDARWLLTGKGNMLYDGLTVVAEPENGYGKKEEECCKRCEDKERIIKAYELLIAEMQKKETPDADSAQHPEAAKHGKTG